MSSACGKLQVTIESLCYAGHGELVIFVYVDDGESRSKVLLPLALLPPFDTRARAIDAISVFSRTMFTPLVQGKESRIVDGAQCDRCSIGNTRDAR